jgi:hypothetical protein
MLKKYNIIQLVDQVNRRLKNEQDFSNKQDNRISDLISERKVRDMLSKNIISKGQKEGKFVYFDDIHVNQILEIKKLQVQGLNERVLKLYSTNDFNSNSLTEKEDNESTAFGASALEELNNIALKMNGNNLSRNIAGSAQAISNSTPVIHTDKLRNKLSGKSSLYESTENEFLKGTQTYRDLQKLSVKSYMEYPLDKTGSLILKIESGYKPKNIEEILEKIKQIIGE